MGCVQEDFGCHDGVVDLIDDMGSELRLMVRCTVVFCRISRIL